MDNDSVRINIETSPSIPNLKIITIGGSFDTVTSKQVDERVLPIIEHEKSNFILNLSNLIYLSSVGLLRLIKYVISTTDQDRLLKLVKPPKHIYSIFVAAGIARHFDMYDSVEEAISSF
jgi:anti-anti-sigma factor